MKRKRIKKAGCVVEDISMVIITHKCLSLQRLQRELEIWLKLKHDNIVPLYGTASGFGPFVAMVCPWYENGSLSNYLESIGKALSVVDRFRLVGLLILLKADSCSHSLVIFLRVLNIVGTLLNFVV